MGVVYMCHAEYSCLGCLKMQRESSTGEQANLGGTGLILTLNYEGNLWNLNFFWTTPKLVGQKILRLIKILALISPLYDYSKYPIKSICAQASFLDILGQKSIFWQKSLKTDEEPMLWRSDDPYIFMT